MKSSMIVHPDELSKAWVDRLVEAGVGIVGIHPIGGTVAATHVEKLLETVKTKKYREAVDYALSRGLEVEYEIHAAGYLMPRDLFAEHPDYFRMNEKGERTSDWNFCVSNPEALELVGRRAADLAMALYGSRPYFYFWMEDAHNIHCQCPKCKELTPSDQQMIALNCFLRAIKQRIPNAHMAYLAYMDSIVPPVSVRPEEGIFLEYAPFEKYTAKGDNAEEMIRREKEMLLPLMTAFDDEPKKVLEYWYDNSMYSGWKKPPKKFVLKEEPMRADIAEYKRMGFDFISTFACFLGADYEELHGEVDVKPYAEAILN